MHDQRGEGCATASLTPVPAQQPPHHTTTGDRCGIRSSVDTCLYPTPGCKPFSSLAGESPLVPGRVQAEPPDAAAARLGIDAGVGHLELTEVQNVERPAVRVDPDVDGTP